jgi:hypothetical protein
MYIYTCACVCVCVCVCVCLPVYRRLRVFELGLIYRSKLMTAMYCRYQPNIRLPSVDVKVSVCESVLIAFARLEAWHRLEDMKGTLSQLKALETCLENAQLSLSRKLGIPRSKSDHNLPTDEPEIYRKDPREARKHQVK